MKHRVVRLADLTPAQRRLVLALIEAAREQGQDWLNLQSEMASLLAAKKKESETE